MAAVLAVGRGAVLSHRSAAALLNLRPTGRTRIDVTTPHSAHPRRDIDVHRVRALPELDVTSARGIPCTIARTLLDLAEVLPRRELERAIDRAELDRLLDLAALEQVLRDHPTRHAVLSLRALLSEYAIGRGLPRSELEERFLMVCVRAGLPRPELNVALSLPDGGEVVVDALWRRQRLVAEADGRAAHATRAAFERDRRHRDAQLLLAGFRVVRFTWRQVTQEPRRVAATVRSLLQQGVSDATAR
jgi:hypothetical protein